MLVNGAARTYTEAAMLSTILLVAAILGQVEREPRAIVLKDGTRLTGFVDERDLSKTLVQVELDEPWAVAPETRTISGDQIQDHYVLTTVELGEYYRKGWTEHGGIEVETAHGAMWVFAEEAELAERAAAMARANEEAVLKTVEIGQGSGADTVAPEYAGPGFGQLWGVHIAVLTLGIGLGGLAVWFLILE